MRGQTPKAEEKKIELQREQLVKRADFARDRVKKKIDLCIGGIITAFISIAYGLTKFSELSLVKIIIVFGPPSILIWFFVAWYYLRLPFPICEIINAFKKGRGKIGEAITIQVGRIDNSYLTASIIASLKYGGKEVSEENIKELIERWESEKTKVRAIIDEV